MRARLLVIFVCLWPVGHAHAQTTAGVATTVVFPVAAQTVSFASEMTLFNPGPGLLTASVKFYEANNSGAPGPKVCNDVSVPADRSVQITLSTQCALTGSGSHFGLVVVADKAVPQVNAFYGYTRVQNPQGIGFSVEGFPVTNFNNQVSHATGLKRKAAAPTYQTNCFVGSLDQPVSYQLKLFNDSTGAQVGGTLTGSLAAFQQFRYLDVFGINGVNAAAGDLQNVRAQFTQTSGGSANLIGFCTVQDNTSFGADFRIAKSYGSPSSTFFAQGGNAFGTTALLGTTDNQPMTLLVNNQAIMRLSAPNSGGYPDTMNINNGSPLNTIDAGVAGGTISGGGGTVIIGPAVISAPNHLVANPSGAGLVTIGGGGGNTASGEGATVAGGYFNAASNLYSTVAGGTKNTASNFEDAVLGGSDNTASGGNATVGGGSSNVAGGVGSTVVGGYGNSAGGAHSSVLAGHGNSAGGDYSSALGGLNNSAGGLYSVAAGHDVTVTHGATFVWNGWAGTGSAAASFRDNSFQIHGQGGLDIEYGARRADGGGTAWVFIGNGFPGQAIATYTGAFLSTGGVWTNNSDRARKTLVEPVDTRAILEKVSTLPITSWHYREEDKGVRHIGPMAQDFYAAFTLGPSETAIGTVDADGVALAAIQGLNAKLETLTAQVHQKDREIDALRTRVSALESLNRDLRQIKDILAEMAGSRSVLNAATSRLPLRETVSHE